MAQSLLLYDVLRTICPNVYYQPPENKKLKYPCIVYDLDNTPVLRADDRLYVRHKKYTVTVIDSDPYSTIPDLVLELPYCSHDRTFVTDNLYHYVLTLYCSKDGWTIPEGG
jgi:hypothetical protein